MREQGSGLIRHHVLPFGAELLSQGGVRFRFFAPAAATVLLAIEGSATVPMQSDGHGWHEIVVPKASAGTRYHYLLPNGTKVPDPVSRYQPEDVAGPSEVIDPGAFLWRQTDWAGRPWVDAVLYELHVGTFTPEGTLRAAAEHLDDLVDLASQRSN